MQCKQTCNDIKLFRLTGTLVLLRLTATIHHYSWLLLGASGYVGTCRDGWMTLNDMLAASTASIFHEAFCANDHERLLFVNIFHFPSALSPDLFVDLGLCTFPYLLVLLYLSCRSCGCQNMPKLIYMECFSFLTLIRLWAVRPSLSQSCVTPEKTTKTKITARTPGNEKVYLRSSRSTD